MSARLRGTAAEVVPVSFHVRCDCGCEIDGTRSTSWKQINCPQCQTTLYILPTNVYPSTASVPSEVIGGGAGYRLRVVLGELVSWPRSRSASASQVKPRTRRKQPPEGASEQPTVRWRRPQVSIPRLNPFRFLRSVFTPLRLLVLSMLLLVGGTSYWMYDRSRQEDAKKIWHESMDELPERLAGDDFDALQQTLLAASNAGSLIGQHGQQWRLVRNLLLETQAVTSVSYETLTELLSELAMLPAEESQDRSSVEAALTGGVFVVDGYIDPEDSKNRRFLLDIPTMSGDTPVDVVLQLPALAEYMDSHPSRRFVCAFRIDGLAVARPNALGPVWEVQVAPESFVLMTSEKHCEQMGFSTESDPSLADVLAGQRTFVEESEAWEQRLDAPHEARQVARRGNE